jgi:glycoside hydrolase-like protein
MRSFALAVLLLLVVPVTAAAKVVHFRGEEAKAPASWPVYRLAAHRRMCVRLDRRAVYLGTPSASQRCPAHAVGARKAILIDPRPAARASALPTVPRAAPRASSSATPEPFAGLGFDACAAPSLRTMAAWTASPYRAIGVYIGGANRACSQPNLTTTWVATQLAAGWHLIPTYVGLQSPASSCSSCAKLSSARASTQGSEDAEDAVAQAQSVGIGAGNPIYFDMEGYTRTTTASRATLTFLSAWTTRLQTLGYVSGVYSSSASGIADIAGEIGTGYALPDDLWTANWNGQANTLDPYVPSSGWSLHQRLHQYRGGHAETWGRATIDLDNDYVDGATVGAVAPAASLPPLTVSGVKVAAGTVRVRVRCGWPAGEVCPGQIVMRSHIRLPAARRAAPSRSVQVAIAHRAFRLAGGRTHTFLVTLNARGRPLYSERVTLKAQLLVAIPGARTERALTLRRAR